MGEKFTNAYVSIEESVMVWINNYLQKKRKEDSQPYSKNQVLKDLIMLGIDVRNGKYMRIDPKIDKFVEQLQTITIEKNGESFVYEKSKESVYTWLIEKGLEHLED